MPVSPELARELAKDTLEVYSEAERRLLELLAERLARGIDDPGWVDDKLADITAIRRAIQRVLDQLGQDGTDTAAKAIQEAYQRGVATVARDLAAKGAIPEIAYAPVGNTRAIDALVRATVERLDELPLRIVRSTVDLYRSVITDAAGQTLVGAATRREAAARAMTKFARRGITGYIDAAGRSWDLASYAEMSVRTSTAQASVQGGIDRMVEAGRRLVIVSDSPEECKLCRPWEGKILTLDGRSGTIEVENPITGDLVKVRVAGTLRDATRAGLFHPNCTHSVSAYTPGVTRRYRATANPEGNRLRNEQRRLERQVREWKRREAAVAPFGGPEAERVKARRKAAQARLREFVSEHDRKNLSYRTSLASR